MTLVFGMFLLPLSMRQKQAKKHLGGNGQKFVKIKINLPKNLKNNFLHLEILKFYIILKHEVLAILYKDLNPCQNPKN